MNLSVLISEAEHSADRQRVRYQEALRKLAFMQARAVELGTAEAHKAWFNMLGRVEATGRSLAADERELGNLRASVPVRLSSILVMLYGYEKGDGKIDDKTRGLLESERATLERIATDIHR